MRSADQRFDAKVSDCLMWSGGRTPAGYGLFYLADDTMVYAHIVAYERVNGPVPEGLQLDHLCRNRACVRVDHLEAVTPRVNAQRGASQKHPIRVEAADRFCKNGHWMDAENTYWNSRGASTCRACKVEQMRALRAQRGSRRSGRPRLPVAEPLFKAASA